MLNITEDKTRERGEGQFFVELTSNRGLDIVNCDRLGYWCGKPHLEHMLMCIANCFDKEELKTILNLKEEEYEPKDGDIVAAQNPDSRWVIIYNSKGSYNTSFYAGITDSENLYVSKPDTILGMQGNTPTRPATEEEKQRLFDVLAKGGWKWNAEKKELEKIPEQLKAGDLVIVYNKKVPKEAFIIYYENILVPFDVVVKFESMEQYEKIRRGEND